ncbi:hypothetical protein OA098_01075, partial [Prochlorococcus sp. AH-736-B04]|nr:hypothetical protein [Prochlorococcus sp. AH-736-B04]
MTHPILTINGFDFNNDLISNAFLNNLPMPSGADLQEAYGEGFYLDEIIDGDYSWYGFGGDNLYSIEPSESNSYKTTSMNYTIDENNLDIIDLDASENVTWEFVEWNDIKINGHDNTYLEDNFGDQNPFEISSDGVVSWKEVPTYADYANFSFELNATDQDGNTSSIHLGHFQIKAGENTNISSYGTNSANTMNGASGKDKLYGLGGDDTLNGNENDDQLYGGYGDDTLYGGDDNDELYGEMGNDILYGGDGNDRLTGGEGTDILIGGKGDDTYVLDDKLDTILDQGSNSDNDTIILRYNVQKYTLASGIRDLELDSNVKKVNGNDLGNTIVGSSGSNTINGKSGNDTLNGGKGNDKLIGGTGKDTALFSKKSNVVDLSTTKIQNTGDGKDTLVEIENISSGGGNDKLYGSKGSNTLNGGNGNDLLIGGAGKDKLIGGAGKDIFKLSKGSGFDLINDFKNNKDKIQVGSIKKLKIKINNNDAYVYSANDLLAKVKGAAGVLSKQG